MYWSLAVLNEFSALAKGKQYAKFLTHMYLSAVGHGAPYVWQSPSCVAIVQIPAASHNETASPKRIQAFT